jgi:hypothetical protein
MASSLFAKETKAIAEGLKSGVPVEVSKRNFAQQSSDQYIRRMAAKRAALQEKLWGSSSSGGSSGGDGSSGGNGSGIGGSSSSGGK